MPAMLGCNTVCPNCRHSFTCCPATSPEPPPCCAFNRRALHALSGGGIVNATHHKSDNDNGNLSIPPSHHCHHSPQVSPSAPLAFVLPFPQYPSQYPQPQGPCLHSHPQGLHCQVHHCQNTTLQVHQCPSPSVNPHFHFPQQFQFPPVIQQRQSPSIQLQCQTSPSVNLQAPSVSVQVSQPQCQVSVNIQCQAVNQRLAPQSQCLAAPVQAPVVASGHTANGNNEPPKPEVELQRLAETVRLLRESNWYHEGLSWRQSQDVLKGTEPGTFLIRDSSDPRFLYALSVQTDQGPTSVRLHYTEGKFRLDSEPYLAPLMPLFDSVLDLIVHYVQCSSKGIPPTMTGTSALIKAGLLMGSTEPGQVWVDANGCLFSRILLKKPLLRADRVPSLQHLARLAVHKRLEESGHPNIPLLPPPHTQLELPKRLVQYLAEYPYSL